MNSYYAWHKTPKPRRQINPRIEIAREIFGGAAAKNIRRFRRFYFCVNRRNLRIEVGMGGGGAGAGLLIGRAVAAAPPTYSG
jgi:hypothetical protein